MGLEATKIQTSGYRIDAVPGLKRTLRVSASARQESRLVQQEAEEDADYNHEVGAIPIFQKAVVFMQASALSLERVGTWRNNTAECTLLS